MNYRIEWATGAQHAVESLPRDVARRIYARVDSLASNPRPNGCQKLQGGDNEYRVRVGDYRIVYAIEDKAILVIVLRVRHRRDVYRR